MTHNSGVMDDIKKKQKFDSSMKRAVGSPYELNTFKNTPVKNVINKVKEAEKKMKKADPFVRS